MDALACIIIIGPNNVVQMKTQNRVPNYSVKGLSGKDSSVVFTFLQLSGEDRNATQKPSFVVLSSSACRSTPRCGTRHRSVVHGREADAQVGVALKPCLKNMLNKHFIYSQS